MIPEMYRALVLTLALLGLAFPALPQTITATITGQIKDPQGANVPKATVVITSKETAETRTTKTDDKGSYTVPFLKPGTYDISATAPGFGKLTRTGITLEVAQTIEFDLSLPLDKAANTVEVVDEAPLLNTETSNLETVVENKLINELPTGERSTLSFINLIPGVIDGGFAAGAGENLNTNGNAQGPIGSAGNRNFFDSNFSVSGGQASTNDVLLDGVSNTIGDFNGIAINPPPDSIREFKVMSGAVPAEYGRTGSAVVNFITKAGTKQFHGSGYEYFQNGALNANGWQRNRRGVKADGTPNLPRIPIKRNQFGMTLGGPVKLPKAGTIKNTFFFFNYEGRREANPFSKQLTVPTDKMRKGDLSELLTGAVRAGQTNADGSPALFGQLYDPYSPLVNSRRATIDGNRLDRLPACPTGNIRTAACLDPVGLKLMSYLPLPNQAGLTDNYNYSGIAKFQRDLYAGRIDTQLTERHSLFGRYSMEDRYQAEPSFLNSIASNSRTINDTFYNVTLNEVWLARPNIINNFRYGYTRARAHQVLVSEGTDPSDTLGLPAYIGATAPIPSFPIFSFSSAGAEGQGFPGEMTSGQISGGGNNQPRDTQTLANSVTFLRGKHTIKTGAEYRLYRFFANQYTNPNGTFTFNRTFTRGPVPTAGVANQLETGSSLASLLLGLPAGISKESVIPTTLYHHYAGLFLQDDWRVNQRLTINAGLRWDVETGTAETHDQVTTFAPNAPSPLAGRVGDPTDPATKLLRGSYANLPGLLSFPKGPQNKTHFNRFAPRLGLAYRLNNKTTIRAGYALVFVPISVEQATALGNVFTTSVSQSDNTVQIIQPGGTASPSVFLTNPFPGGIPAAPGNTQGAQTLMGQAITIVYPDRPNPYNSQWNLVISRQLARNVVFDIAYVGSSGRNLPAASLNLNQLPGEWLDFARANFANYNDVNGRPATSAAGFFSAQVANPFFGVITNPNSALRTATITRGQLLSPFPQYTGVTLYRPHIGSLSYNGLQLSVQKRFSQGISMTGNYVWSKSIDTGGPGNNSGQGTPVENIYNIRLSRSISNFDVPQRVVFSTVWEMPFFKRSKMLAPRVLLKGWQLSGTGSWQRGTPIGVTSSGVGLGFAVRRADRVPELTANFPLGLAQDNARAGKSWFNTPAFVVPNDFRLGTAARNYADLRRDNFKNVNLSVARNFMATEKIRIQFRAEFLNAMNQVVFGTPGRDVSTPSTFGLITTQGNTPRNIQLVLRGSF